MPQIQGNGNRTNQIEEPVTAWSIRSLRRGHGADKNKTGDRKGNGQHIVAQIRDRLGWTPGSGESKAAAQGKSGQMAMPSSVTETTPRRSTR
jgi:hypothetical protein